MHSQILFTNYYGKTGNHYATHKLWNFLLRTEFIITKIVKTPIVQEHAYIIDGLTNSIWEIHGTDVHQSTNTSLFWVQQVKLAFLIHILLLIHELLNVISDSAFVGGYFQQDIHTCLYSNLTCFIKEERSQADAVTWPIFTFLEENW